MVAICFGDLCVTPKVDWESRVWGADKTKCIAWWVGCGQLAIYLLEVVECSCVSIYRSLVNIFSVLQNRLDLLSSKHMRWTPFSPSSFNDPLAGSSKFGRLSENQTRHHSRLAQPLTRRPQAPSIYYLQTDIYRAWGLLLEHISCHGHILEVFFFARQREGFYVLNVNSMDFISQSLLNFLRWEIFK